MTERPAPQILWSWMAAVVALALPLTGLLWWLLWLFLPGWLSTILPVWGGAVFLLLGVYLPLRRHRLTFSLEAEQITVTGGVLITTTRCMRTDAVRQITLLQGPLERRFHTAFLRISATGGSLLVEGIHQKTAEEWCRRLSPL